MAPEFEWDDDKNAANLTKHGISFEEAAEIFKNPVYTKVDDRFDYGEPREISVGILGETIVISVVHTDREGRTRMISARKATRKERRLYYAYLEKALG
ncbi:MAG: BrnT family toxin [Alphaproteobacteria bacterium]